MEIKKIVFLHIPKTGGTTLHQIIERQYRPDVIYTLNQQQGRSIESFEALPESKRNAIRVLKGHTYFGLRSCLSKSNVFITLLREPINRIISHYFYVRGFPGHYLHQDVTSRGLSLEEYAENPLSEELDNGQTRLISGVTGVPIGGVNRMMFEKAKENLRTYFSVVGVTERFDEFLILLKKTFGWKNCFYIQANVSKQRRKKRKLPKGTLKMIEEKNIFDIKLYHFASEMFDEAIRRQNSDFGIEVRTFKVMNQAYRVATFFNRAVGFLKREFLLYVQA